jgi:putative flippase GtrA
MDQLRTNRLVRYVVVGAAAYLIEMGALFLLQEVVRLSGVASVAISFWIGFVVAFVLQKYVAFQHRDARPKVLVRQLAIYSVLVAWNYIFTLAIAHFFANIASIFVLRTIVILIVTVWNFAVYRLVFKEQGKGGSQENA